ncbi:hypothetical protein [Streptosporangium sp. NPDC051022]|uniref:hypothetical protein n=1 Tax=Streptosporangium sp. NPDC051022 TaxID=3155752 RepID=UPI0034279DCF
MPEGELLTAAERRTLHAVPGAVLKVLNRLSCDLEDGHDGAHLALAQHTDDWAECGGCAGRPVACGSWPRCRTATAPSPRAWRCVPLPAGHSGWCRCA